MNTKPHIPGVFACGMIGIFIGGIRENIGRKNNY
tara:strand:+ start:180 stop:281 length:102 start_codon:yes stop_codon:yes gene_type:complete